MDISDITSGDYISISSDETIGKARSKFEQHNPKGIIVKKDGDYAHVLSEQKLLQSHIKDDTKVKTFIRPSRSNPVPRLTTDENVRNVARKMVESGVKVAPVFNQGDELVGVITVNDILESVINGFEEITVEQIYTDSPITVSKDVGVGTVINRLRENSISRVPVVNDENALVGIVTTFDISDVAVRNMTRMQKGDKAGERDRVLDIPVRDVMNSPVTTITKKETVAEAVRVMLSNNYGGLVVTGENSNTPEGVITKTDALRALTYEEKDYLQVQVTNVQYLSRLSRETIRETIQEITNKYQNMHVQHAHVRFHEHKESLRGTKLIQCKIRLITNKGQVAGTGEGFGDINSFRIATDKLERNVLELKGVHADKEYEGNVLRKINQL